MQSNILTKFGGDWIINMAPRILTRVFLGSDFYLHFDTTWPSFELIQVLMKGNILTEFGKYRAKNMEC